MTILSTLGEKLISFAVTVLDPISNFRNNDRELELHEPMGGRRLNELRCILRLDKSLIFLIASHASIFLIFHGVSDIPFDPFPSSMKMLGGSKSVGALPLVRDRRGMLLSAACLKKQQALLKHESPWCQ
ncbi:hypothetical protein ACJJTC_006306 [Scirpophaga incertulas]